MLLRRANPNTIPFFQEEQDEKISWIRTQLKKDGFHLTSVGIRNILQGSLTFMDEYTVNYVHELSERWEQRAITR